MLKWCVLIMVVVVAIWAHDVCGGDFIFGVWSNFPKQSGEYSNFRQVLGEMKSSLHFNTILNQCYTAQFEDAVRDSGMYVIVANESARPDAFLQAAANDTTNYPRVYSESIYTTWESEGNSLGPSPVKLRYNGGVNEVIGTDVVRHFTATGQWRDSTIQFGPDSAQSCIGGHYYQKQFYWPSMISSTELTNVVQYHLQLRFKLGPRLPGTLDSDTIAVFYMQRIAKSGSGVYEADESYPGNEDPYIEHTKIAYIINGNHGSAATDLIWSDTLKYEWSASPCYDRQNGCYGAQFKVRWFNNRDIYIDKIKMWDDYGRELWEEPNNTAYPRLDNWFATYFRSSDAVLGYYIMDDRGFSTGRDHVFSTRLIDSLMVHRFGAKMAINVPSAYDSSYIALEQYSNISYQNYPVRVWNTSSSAPNDSTSIQDAWNEQCQVLSSMAGIAIDKNVPHYSTLQGFALDCIGNESCGSRRPLSWRTPTGIENLCMVNLSLAYGAKGILYWKYDAVDHCDNQYFPAFVDPSGQRAAMYYQVRDTVGPWVETIGQKIVDLDWQGACAWNKVRDSSFSFIDSIGSLTFSPDKAFIHTGYFKDSDNIDHVLLVNKRCLPSETQTFRVYFDGCDTPLDLGWLNRVEVEDVLTGTKTIVDTQCSPEKVPGYYTVTLGPGQAKLLKVVPNQVLWGQLTGQVFLGGGDELGGGFLILGDLEVTEACTLQTSSARIRIAVNSDFMASGIDPTKTEIIVNGVLIADDTNFRLEEPTTSFDAWRGIRVGATGKIIMRGCRLTHAYSAILDEGLATDTIFGSTIDSCKVYGIKTTNPNLAINNNVINWINDGYGIYVQDSCNIFGNQFGKPGQSSVNGMPQYTAIYAKNSNAVIDSNVFFSDGADEFIDYGIVVDNRKSITQPLLIQSAFMYRPRYGITILKSSNVKLVHCELYGSLAQGTDNQIGVTDGAGLTIAELKSSIIEGFRTGIHSRTGQFDLGTHSGSGDGNNSIYPPCKVTGDSCAYWQSAYNFVTSNSVSGTIMAEGNRWVPPCSTNTAPDVGRVPDNLDSSPLGNFSFEWCEDDSNYQKVLVNLPLGFNVLQNYPNPFNPTTEITYSLQRSTHVELTIFNILGQRVATLVDADQLAGWYRVAWNGRNSSGEEVASGVYLYRLKADEHTSIKKMVMLK